MILELYQHIVSYLDIRFVYLNLSLVSKEFNFISSTIKFRSIELNKFPKLTNLKKLTDLRRLDLGSNENIYDQDISNLTNLERLYLNCNKNITDDGIKNLTNLKRLDL